MNDIDRFLRQGGLEIPISFSKSREEEEIYIVVLAQLWPCPLISWPCPLILITSALPSASKAVREY